MRHDGTEQRVEVAAEQRSKILNALRAAFDKMVGNARRIDNVQPQQRNRALGLSALEDALSRAKASLSGNGVKLSINRSASLRVLATFATSLCHANALGLGTHAAAQNDRT